MLALTGELLKETFEDICDGHENSQARDGQSEGVIGVTAHRLPQPSAYARALQCVTVRVLIARFVQVAAACTRSPISGSYHLH